VSKHSILWFLALGGAFGGGSAASVRTPVEGKIGADTAAWTPACKAIRKICGTEIASAAVTLGLDVVYKSSVQLGEVGEGCIIRPGVFLAFSA
jgi:hypothetical protein